MLVLEQGDLMSVCCINVPKEVKPREGRVGITPSGIRVLVAKGHKVGIQQGAGALSGFSDNEYVSAGAMIYGDVRDLYRDADIIVKVKELVPGEYQFIPLLKGKVLFTYLHLAGVDPELTRLLLRHEVTAIAYESVTQIIDGRTILPLLVPMSRIAGEQSVLTALARYKEERYRELEVVIVGGGVVGEAAIQKALENKVASIAVFESREERVRELRNKYSAQPDFWAFPLSFLETEEGKYMLKSADIVISGVRLPDGAPAPHVLTQKHFRIMKKGAYIADVAIDQGGSTAWSRVTKPGETFTRGKKELVFSCVPNIPGSTVPAEATRALTEATLPYVRLIGEYIMEHGRESGLYYVLKDHPDLRLGLQTFHGYLVNNAVALKHQLFDAYKPLDTFF